MVELRSVLEHIISGRDLAFEEAYEIATAMLRREIDDVGIAALLVALRAKGEASSEIAGFAHALRNTCVKVEFEKDLLDTAGTGGDGAHTINVSTAAALTAAALGAYVAKHGNRSVSSKSGSADFLEKLGYKIDHGPETARCMLEKARFTFLFAPRYHPAMKAVMPVRKKLGIRTIFNLVGPLANPANARMQVLGVAMPELLEKMAGIGGLLGYKRLLVVHGEPGIDEVSVSGKTIVLLVEGENVERITVTPEELGVKRHPLDSLRVGGPEESVERVMSVFRGAGRSADRDFIAMNAGFALYAAGVVKDYRDGVELALQAFSEGLVARYVEEVLEVQRQCLSSKSAE